MSHDKIAKKQINMLYDELIQLSKATEDKEMGKSEKDSMIYQRFSISTISGRCFFNNLSDEQLLDVIKSRASEIGHSPSQKEVFWIWRDYIKLRFKKWPYALTEAGLMKSAGTNGGTLEQAQKNKNRQKQIIHILQEKAKMLGRIPHPKDLPELSMELRNKAGSWQVLIEEANLNQEFFISNSLYKITDLEKEYELYLYDIKSLANSFGRAPMRGEVNPLIRTELTKRCGSWRNALYQIDLEPVIRIKPFSSTNLNPRGNKKKHHQDTLFDCYYKVLNMDDSLMEDLLYLKKMATTQGYLPRKNEVDKKLKGRLQNKCGSWSNALYQIKYLEDKK